MPLVDVVFLLLTFFVFSLVMMVRADILDVSLPRLGAGKPLQRETVLTITIDEAGGVFLDAQPVPIDSLGAEARAALDKHADSPIRVVIATDQHAQASALLHVLDALAGADVKNVSVMGRPGGPTPQSP